MQGAKSLNWSNCEIENKKVLMAVSKSGGKLKVAVLMGGIGSEREVSLRSGASVACALGEAGLEVVAADIGPDRLGILEDKSVDVFFPVLHGMFGEDGQLQQILEDRSLFYTGSEPEACRAAFDKIVAKNKFERFGVKTAAGVDIENIQEQLSGLGGRYVVKPTKQGSSVGVRIVDGKDEVAAAARVCLDEFGNCMIEEFIDGREVTVGILCGEVLPIIELRTRTGFYDYHAKYADEQTEFLFDTIADAGLVERIEAAAIVCFESLRCRDFARVDMRISKDGEPVVLELNTIPGFTDRSDLPKAAAKAGIEMSQLCLRIVEAAVARIENLELRI